MASLLLVVEDLFSYREPGRVTNCLMHHSEPSVMEDHPERHTQGNKRVLLTKDTDYHCCFGRVVQDGGQIQKGKVQAGQTKGIKSTQECNGIGEEVA